MDIQPEVLRDMLAVLSDFPSNGKPPPGDASEMLVLVGFIERKEITKPCRSCGKGQHDYSYFRMTAAGRLFLEAARGQFADLLPQEQG